MMTPAQLEGMVVDVPWLANGLDDPSLRVLDAAGQSAFERAHIPRAIGIGRDAWLKEPDPTGNERGTHLLPPAELARHLGEIGIGPTDSVVVYDDTQGLEAGRLWWVLRHLGHEKVAILDGGWAAWVAAGAGVETGSVTAPPNTFRLHIDASRLASFDRVRKAVETGEAILLDARSDEEWSGADLHGNPRNGHLPGARRIEWWSTTIQAAPAWRFLRPEALRQAFVQHGLGLEQPVITYCQAGIRAAHLAFALELAGFSSVSVYDASIREWAADPTAPLVTGDSP